MKTERMSQHFWKMSHMSAFSSQTKQHWGQTEMAFWGFSSLFSAQNISTCKQSSVKVGLPGSTGVSNRSVMQDGAGEPKCRQEIQVLWWWGCWGEWGPGQSIRKRGTRDRQQKENRMAAGQDSLVGAEPMARRMYDLENWFQQISSDSLGMSWWWSASWSASTEHFT